MDYSGRERRQNKRYAEQLVVQWQRQRSPEAAPGDEWDYAFIRDISTNGLCFETGKSLAVGDLLYFKVKIHFALWPFNCTGQVLRVRPLQRAGSFEVAATFLHIDPKDADLVDLYAWEQSQRKDRPGRR